MNGQVFSALIEGGGKVMTTTLPHLIAPLHRQLPVESQLSHKFIRWKGSKMLYHWLFTTLPSPQPKILPFFNKSSQRKIYFLEKKKIIYAVSDLLWYRNVNFFIVWSWAFPPYAFAWLWGSETEMKKPLVVFLHKISWLIGLNSACTVPPSTNLGGKAFLATVKQIWMSSEHTWVIKVVALKSPCHFSRYWWGSVGETVERKMCLRHWDKSMVINGTSESKMEVQKWQKTIGKPSCYVKIWSFGKTKVQA